MAVFVTLFVDDLVEDLDANEVKLARDVPVADILSFALLLDDADAELVSEAELDSLDIGDNVDVIVPLDVLELVVVGDVVLLLVLDLVVVGDTVVDLLFVLEVVPDTEADELSDAELDDEPDKLGYGE